ncbi:MULTISPECIES: IS21 family transposase [Lactococcus]|uniref:IS21 family transposase n=1 Tax=Lactococcus formosensis TaxID=1281486 RepID=A0A9Q9D7G2_9LACT|nr:MULTISPECIES: IS21 family transposase [Lactococcus]USI66554.1 IS21 family transposase [Lactococcus petauri]USI66630.1 IS21 family transposase [Lactococcus petauri]USI67455.1 IS21 family transposase [Lactococcus petauri]USI69007.1 IS21 family transposase [Lactococcus petauri]USJ21263.1 IS21 family transposase [Lactococcus formosensis]
MRKDILESLSLHFMNDTKPNFADLARRYNCDYRTVKRYYELGQVQTLEEASRRRVPPSLIENFKAKINEKIDLGCSARSIFYFIQKQGYEGSYVTVRRYVKSCKTTKQHKATLRVETSPGLSAQVDWKESLKMISKNGEVFTVNIFCYVLGYSRMKYLQLTTDREQATLFDCLNNAFFQLGGIPEEIWFDNMKTVVDHSKSQFTHAVFNETFRQYAKDAGFHPIACRPFRPQTKGKVEALARTVDRLLVFNHEFEDLTELQEIVTMFMEDLNHHESSQALGCPPALRWREDKGNFKAYDDVELSVYTQPKPEMIRKVSKESMVLYEGRKYSLPLSSIGHNVILEVSDGSLEIYDGGLLVAEHQVTDKPFNYRREDYLEIAKSDVYSHLTEEALEARVNENLLAYDEL